MGVGGWAAGALIAAALFIFAVALSHSSAEIATPRGSSNTTQNAGGSGVPVVLRGYILAATSDRFCTVDEYLSRHPGSTFNGTHVIHGVEVYPIVVLDAGNGMAVRLVPAFCKSDTAYYFLDADTEHIYKLDLTDAVAKLKEPLQVGTSRLVYINGTLTRNTIKAHTIHD